MPMKLNVGLSKKVGEANYGSRGASVNLETELDAGVVDDAGRLRDRIRQLFHLARGAIQEELNGHAGNNGNGSQHPQHNGGQANSNPNGNGNGDSRPASAAQCRALRTICQRQKRDLGQLLSQRFGCRQPEQITLPQASSLIDELNATTAGNPL